MGKDILSQVQEAQSVPYRINLRRNTPRHILIKLTKMKYKEKILLYPATISFRFDGEIKPLHQAKVKRIQHHQTSFTTNTKGTSLGRKHKRRKRPTITNPQQLRKW